MNKLNSIFGALWEKRLLPVVIVLVIAVVAIPLLLLKDEKDQSSSDYKPPEPSALTSATLIDQSAVTLGEQVTKKGRLDAFSKKDPFVQKGLGKGGGKSSSGNVEPTEPGSGDTSAGGGSGDTSGGEGTDKSSGAGSGSGGLKLYEKTVDLRFGLAGSKFLTDDKLKNNLSALSPLPSAKNPIIMYMGVSANSPSAVFLVDKNMIVTGEATCMPDKTQCRFLYMRTSSKRNEATFARKSDPDRKYKIKLLDIAITEISENNTTRTEDDKK